MTLRLRATPTPSDSVFGRVLDGIPKGDQWKRGNVIPYSTYGGVPLLLDATPGTLVEVYIDGRVILRVNPVAPTTPITLELNKGYNTVVVKQGIDTFQTLLVATEYAIFLRAFADEVYAAVERDIIEFEQHLASFFSTRITEHQLEFSDLLPPQFAYRTLLSKLAVRAVVNESSTTRGVDDVMTSVTSSTPLVIPEIATTDPNPPNPVYTGADDFGGFKFHYWLPNTCAASWFGFARLVDTLSNPNLHAVSVLDHAIVVSHEGSVYTHYFDTEAESCNSLEDKCAHDVYLAVRITSTLPIWMCWWGHEFDVGIELPLGRGRLDSGIPFDTGIPLDDSDPTAPESGWVGTILTTLDTPRCLDTSVGGASGTSRSALDCCPDPVVALLTESVLSVVVDATPRMRARMTVLPA